MDSNVLLELNGVDYSYHTDKSGNSKVLDSISMTILKGDMVALVGPNGGGKTTLVKIILGILNPQKGSIAVNMDRKKISYVPQYFYSGRDYPLSAMQAVLMGMGKGHRIYTRANKTQAMEVLAKFGVDHVANRRVGTLSPGQLQKVIIARAVMNKPELIVMDEPLSGIDESGQGEIYAHLDALNREGTAIVAVTHDLYAVPKYFQTIACIKKTLHFHGHSSNMDEVAKVIYGSTATSTAGISTDYQRLVHVHSSGLPVRVLDCHECRHNHDRHDHDRVHDHDHDRDRVHDHDHDRHDHDHDRHDHDHDRHDHE